MKYAVKIGMYHVLRPEIQLCVTLCKDNEGIYYWGYGIKDDTIIDEDREALKEELRLAYTQMGESGIRYDEQYFDDGMKTHDGIEISPLKETEDGKYEMTNYEDLIEYFTYVFRPKFTYLICDAANPELCLSTDHCIRDHVTRNVVTGKRNEEVYFSNNKTKWIHFDEYMDAMLEMTECSNEQSMELTVRKEVKF